MMFLGEFEKHSEAKWEADIHDSWEISAITAYLFDGLGVYKAPSSNGPAFLFDNLIENHIGEF